MTEEKGPLIPIGSAPTFSFTPAPAEAQEAIHPTLVIGIGGSGNQIVRRLKRIIKARGLDPKWVRFLVIDTDKNEFAEKPGLPALDYASERFRISGSAVKQVFEKRKKIPELDWIPPDLNPAVVFKEQGCGQIRACGRLSLFSMASNLVQTMRRQAEELAQLLNTLRAVEEGRGIIPVNRPSVYIIGSLCGGTGSGMVIDMPVLVRKAFQHRPNLTGLFLLPSVFSPALQGKVGESSRVKANAYAALRELSYYMEHTPAQGEMPEAYRVFRYPGMDEVDLEEDTQLYNICYLVERQNMDGRLLTDDTDVYEMCALQLFVEMFTALGSRGNSMDENDTVLAGVACDPESGKPRKFSSFGISCYVYPQESVLLYCVAKTALEFIQDLLLNGTYTQSELDQRLDAFLHSNQMDERGPRNQAQDVLGRDQERQKTLAEVFLVREDLPSMSPRDFARALEQAKKKFEGAETSECRRTLARNQQDYLKRAEYAVYERTFGRYATTSTSLTVEMEGLLAERGTRGATQFLERLLTTCEIMENEMISESRAWTEERGREVEFELSQSLQALSAKRGGIFDILSGRQIEEMKRDALKKINEWIAGKVRAMVMDEAAQFFGELRKRVARVLVLVRKFETNLALILPQLEQIVQTIEKRPPEGAFLLERSVISSEERMRYYEERRPRPLRPLLTRTLQSHPEFLTPAFLESANVEKLWSIIENTCLERFKGDLSNQNVRSYLTEENLSFLYQITLPFWLVEPGDQFSDSTLIAMNGRIDPVTGEVVFDPEFTRWLMNIANLQVQGLQSHPHPVLITDPLRLYISRRAHGARVNYFKDCANWKYCYDQATGYPLHITDHFKYIPENIMITQEQEALKAFALAGAFGFLVERGAGKYFWGLSRDTSDDQPRWTLIYEAKSTPRPIELSAIHEVVSEELFRFSYRTKVSPTNRLGDSREGALEQLARKRDMIKMILEAVDTFDTAVARGTFVTEMQAYIDRLSEAAHAASGKKQEIMRREEVALREYLRIRKGR